VAGRFRSGFRKQRIAFYFGDIAAERLEAGIEPAYRDILVK
jgi:hypothetical protein